MIIRSFFHKIQKMMQKFQVIITEDNEFYYFDISQQDKDVIGFEMKIIFTAEPCYMLNVSTILSLC